MKCVCCNLYIKNIDGLEKNEEDAIFTNISTTTESGYVKVKRADSGMWSDGIVANISAGYGSELDGDMFVMAICDNCIRSRIENGVIAYTGNYMFSDKIIEEKIDKYKKIWRRNNNLDNLV